MRYKILFGKPKLETEYGRPGGRRENDVQIQALDSSGSSIGTSDGLQ